jgi:hypothetical protein
MAKINRVNWHNPSLAQITPPVLVGVLVVDPILNIEREEVF